MSNYKLKFSLYGFLAVVIVMIPNIIYFLFPPGAEVLSALGSSNIILDIIENAGRIALILTLSFVVNTRGAREDSKRLKTIAVILMVAYYALWLYYYTEPMKSLDLIAMAVLPVASLIIVAVWLRNHISLIPAAIFGITHIAISCINYL